MLAPQDIEKEDKASEVQYAKQILSEEPNSCLSYRLHTSEGVLPEFAFLGQSALNACLHLKA